MLAAPSIEVVDASVYGSQPVSLQLDSSGFPVIAYVDNGVGLIVIHCNDTFCAGSDESIEIVAGPLPAPSMPSMQLDSSGFPVISYFDGIGDDLRLIHCNDVNCAGSDESDQLVDSTGFVGRYSSLQLDSSGFPVISYLADSGIDLKLAHCNDVNCTGSDESIEIVDSTDDVGENSNLLLDASGNPVIIYYDRTNDDFKLAHCNDANCSGSDESIEVVGQTGAGGIQIGIQLDSSGFPVAAFVNDSIGDLQVLHCNDANCSGSDETLASLGLGTGANFPALQLDGSGNPVIVSSIGTSAIGITTCNDVNCTGNDETETTIETAITSWSNSFVLDGSGAPVIAYLDLDDNELKLARCFDLICSGPLYSSNPTPSSTVDIQGDVGTLQAATLRIRNIGDTGSLLDVTQVGTLTNFTISSLPTSLTPADGNFTITIECTIPQASETLTLQSNEAGNPTYSYLLTCTESSLPTDDDEISTNTTTTSDETNPPALAIFDPAISKIGFLRKGDIGVTGEELEWVVTVSNTSEVAGQNVVITDTVDSRLQIDQVEAPGANVNINGQTVSVIYATLDPQETVIFSIFTTVLDGVLVDNTVCVQADNQSGEKCTTGFTVGELPSTGLYSRDQ